jgi:hypothetical protein
MKIRGVGGEERCHTEGKTKKRTFGKPELETHWLLEDPHKIKVSQEKRKKGKKRL